MNAGIPPPATTATRSPGATTLLLLAIATGIALYFVSLARAAPPPALASDAPEDVFSAERALATLDACAGAEIPHPVGTEAHTHFRDAIVAELARLDLEPEVQETIARGKNGAIALVRNVVARRPGRGAGHAVLLCVHYDSVAAGPGAGDDGAGVATLLEVARALSGEPPGEHPVLFLFTDAEELGLVGASGFVAEHPALAEVAVVVNVEARGTSGPSTMFETSASNARLIEWLAESLERPSAVSAAYEIYERMPNDTDLSVFKHAGIAGYNFAFIGGLRHYHTPRDERALLSADSVQHHGDNVLALVRRLVEAPLAELRGSTRKRAAQARGRTEQEPAAAPIENGSGTDERDDAAPERVVYADVLGLGIVRWPEPASAWLALGSLALVITSCLRLHRAHVLGRRGVLWGAALSCASFVIASGAGFLLASLLALVRGVVDPWCAHPEFLRTSCFAGALAGSAALAGLAATRRAGFAATAVGVALFQALAALATALLVPSASYLFILPALAAGIALVVASAALAREGVARVDTPHERATTSARDESLAPLPSSTRVAAAVRTAFAARALVVLAPLAVAAVLWFPLADAIELAFEFEIAPAISGWIGGAFAFAAPCLADAGRATRRGFVYAALAVMLVSFAAAWIAPVHGAAAPAPLSFVHAEDTATGEARWIARTYRWELPADVARAAEFSAATEPPFAWWPSRDWPRHAAGLVAPARATGAAVPTWTLDADPSPAAGARITARVRSPRAARMILLELPPALALVSVRAHGDRLELDAPTSGFQVLAGFGADEITLELERRVAGEAELSLADVTSGLPVEGRALLDARPVTRVPRGEGDVSVVGVRRSL